MSVPSAGVSVVIPVFDCARYLGDAIESVLAQTLPAREIIVVDDGSSDDSASVARRFAPRVRYVHQEHAGIGAARNRGVDMTHGELLAFLDADDLWTRDKLALQSAAFAASPDLDVVSGHVEQFISGDLAPDVAERLRCPERAFAGSVPGAMLVRRASFLRVGPFDTTRRVGEFLDWQLRATDARLRFETLSDVVLRRRIHGGNQGIRERDRRDDYAHVLKAALDRRRRAADSGSAPHPDGSRRSRNG